MTARRVLTWLVAFAAVLTLAPAAAAQYPPSDQQLTVTDTSPEPGQEVLVAGDGFMPGSTVSIYFESVPVLLATATVDQQGHFAVWVRIPRDAEQGWHLFRVKGTGTDGRPRELTIPIYVSAAAAAFGQRAPVVAKTRPAARTAVGIVAILVAIVITMTLVLRRRRRAHRQPVPAPSALLRPVLTNPSGATANDRWGLGGKAHGHTDREQPDEQVEAEASAQGRSGGDGPEVPGPDQGGDP